MPQIAIDVSEELMKALDDFCDAANAKAGARVVSRQSVALAGIESEIKKRPAAAARKAAEKPAEEEG